VQSTGADAAKKLVEEVLPKVFAAASGKEEVKPTSQEIGGQTVYSLSAGRGPALVYGRHGSTIVLGMSPDPVAQALGNGAKKRGLLADPKVAASLEKLKDPVFVGVAKPVSLVAGLVVRVRPREGPRPGIESEPPRPVPPDRKPPAPPAVPKRRAALAEPGTPDGRGERVPKELADLIAQQGLLVMHVTRGQDRILEEITLTDLKPMVGKLTDLALQWFRPGEAPRRPRPERPPGTEPAVPPRER
jgi:hypothetical protein